ncbi:hypothetical protein GmHk_04G011111 [Glycine max]|nr:hypothetical protein GmHk_04G011111 [Glycine max]
MVRTRELHRALGGVIRRAVGIKRQRPTTFARRQQAVAPVAEDVKHVYHAVDKVHEQPQEAVTDDVVANAQGFLGGPNDTSILMEYVYHVTTTIWNRGERPELKLSSYGRKVEKFGRSALEIEGIVAATRLSLLIACSLDTGDRGLISAFAER